MKVSSRPDGVYEMYNGMYFCCVLVAIFMADNVIEDVIPLVLHSGRLKHLSVEHTCF